MAHDDDAGAAATATSSDATTATSTASEVGYPPGAEARPGLTAGTRVDRYLIERRIGAGGMGVVYAARDPDLDRRVAIKVLASGLGRTRGRLLREGQAVARLRHPNVVAIHDVGDHDDHLFIAMELVEGRTLRAWLAARRRGWREVLGVFVPAGRGLAAAHAAGLVHRDFKPDNVLIGDDGRVIVTDFGLARAEAGDGDELAGDEPNLTMTRTGEIAGTPAYMSPEQFQGLPIDARSDQFSFCVALFEALHGARPFQRRPGAPSTFDELRAAVVSGRIVEPGARTGPARVHRAIRRGLSPEPGARFPSMDALLDAIAPGRRRPAWWLGAAVGAAAVAAIAIAIAGRGPGPADPAGATRAADPPTGACAAAVARLDAVWNDQARAAQARRAPASPWTAVDTAAFDGFARRWRALRRDVCGRAGAGDGELVARQALCLDNAIGGLARALAQPGAIGWPSLPSLRRCAGDHPDAEPVVRALGMYPGGNDATVLSPDGATIVRATHGHLDVVSAERGDRAQVALRGEAVDVRFTSDGRRLLYADAAGVAELDLAHGRSTPIGPRVAATPYLAPDGRRLAFARDDAMWVAPIAGDAPPRRLAPVVGTVTGVAWSPSARWLIVAAQATTQLPILRVIDSERGDFHDVVLRAPRSLTRSPIPLAWIDERRVIVDADQDDDHGQSIWILDVSGAPDAEPPEVRLPAPPGTAYTIYDAAGSRALALRHQIHDHFGQLVAGTLQPLAGVGDRMSILAVDRAGRRILMARNRHDGATIEWLSLADGVVTPIAVPADLGRPALRGDRLIAVGGHAGAWRLDEQDAAGGWRTVRALSGPGADAPALACGPPPASRCVLLWRDRGWALQALDDAPARLIPIRDRAVVTMAVSPDGGRVALGVLDNELTVVDLARGSETTWPGVKGCFHQHLAWSRTGQGVYAGLVCSPNGYGVARLRPGQPPEIISRAHQWTGPLAVGPDEQLYVNQRTFDQDYVLIDGL